jgi:UDP-N-acetyl-D-glucosamine dehydrogenase
VGVPATFIKRANEVNLAMPAYVVKRVIAGSGGSIAGKSVVVVGVSYKSNVADIRETPAAAVIDLLRQQGASVTWHDEIVKTLKYEKSVEIKSNEIAIIATMHSGVEINEVLKISYVFDCTNTLKNVNKL